MAGLTMPLPLKVIATILGMEADDDAYLAEVTAKVIAALAGEEPARSEGIAAARRGSPPTSTRSSRRGLAAPGHRPHLGHRPRPHRGRRAALAPGDRVVHRPDDGGRRRDDRPRPGQLHRDPARSTPTSWPRSAPTRPARRRVLASSCAATASSSTRTASSAETSSGTGQPSRAGAIVRVALISANNDETVFADPRRFDLARPDLRLGKESRAGGRIDGVANHLGFGLGKHFCIGYQLARAEIVDGHPWPARAHARHARRRRAASRACGSTGSTATSTASSSDVADRRDVAGARADALS